MLVDCASKCLSDTYVELQQGVFIPLSFARVDWECKVNAQGTDHRKVSPSNSCRLQHVVSTVDKGLGIDSAEIVKKYKTEIFCCMKTHF